jgi:hypothetical protein
VALMPGSKSPEIRQRLARRQVEADEQAAKCGELRLAGLTFRQVAEGVGCSVGAAHRGWLRFRKSLVRGAIEDERNVLLARCERQYRQLGSKLAAGDTKAHAVGVEILRLMSDVGGYAAPAQVEVGMHGQPPFSRFEFVVEELPSEEPRPPLEGGERRLLGPADSPEPMQEAS